MPPGMSDYLLARQKAVQQYDTAFHLLTVTYPTVREPRLLLGVLENIFSSMEATMDTILAYERQLLLIPAYSPDFKEKFRLFQQKSLRKHNIPASYVELLFELKLTLELHKRSPMEFERGGRIVICDKDYTLRTVSPAEVQRYLQQAQEFLQQAEKIVQVR